MIKPNTEMVAPRDTFRTELGAYIRGGLVSLLLTVGAFSAILSDLEAPLKIALVSAAALLQIIVHLREFLHLSFSGEQSREDLLLVMFSASLLTLMVGGTVWILSGLNERMHDDGSMQGSHTHQVVEPTPSPMSDLAK